VVAIATAGYGAVAVTAAPAQAQSISSGAGPVTLSWPGGDLVASVDVPGVTPDVMSSDISTAWPEFVGLSPDPSPSALIQATWQHFEANAPAGQDPQPSSFAGGSLSATSDGNGGSTVTLDIPAGDFQANTLPAWLAGALAAAAGVVATVAAIGICTVGFLRVGGPALRALDPNGTLALTTLGLGICAGIGAALGTFITAVVNQWLTGAPFDSDFWQNTASQALVQGLGAAASVWLAGIVVFGLSYAMAGIANTVTTLISFIKPFVSASTWQSIAAGVERFFSRGWQEIETELGNIARRAGFPAPRSSGQVHTPPASTAPANPGTPAAANCIDAYGTDGTNASPGQSVAVNTCNGNAAQNWDYYPNGNIVISGMCVDTQGGTSSIGTPLVDLEPCDGSSSQVWTQSGTALVNGATSDCLDDPNDNTTPGIQLDSYPCNNSAAQQWVTANPQTCDIYASYGTACVAAYSMTRALYAAYDGPLYEVQRASDSATDSIGLLNTGGYVDAAAQDSFCANTTCTITEIYDQSPLGNNLTIEGSGGNGGQDRGAVANALPIKVNGNEAYGLDVESGVGYRDDATIGVATDGAPEGMYMVASGTHVNSGCCFDFGNAEANNDDNGAGHMDAVNLSTTCYGPNGHCTGSGPWVQADMENGLFMGSSYTNTANLGNNTPFVTAMLGNDGQSSFQLNGGDATTGSLSTWYNGPLPSGGYAPMSQEGAVLLGTGGDDSNGDVGSWFEGVMTSGDPSQAADNAVQANIVSAGYSGSTNPSGGTGTGSTNGVTPSAAGPAVVHSAGATGAAASGFSSVYTVDSANGHLQETYLPYMGDNWTTQDLTANYGTPPVMPGTKPVALVHCGYTSVYTVDAGSGDLQETYLPAIGDNWSTQDLSAKYGTPPTDVTPTALVHDAGATGSAAACGFTSVYTVDRGSYDLQETYLPVIGDAWTTQNLSANYGTPAVQEGTSPVAIVHCGYTSVYTVDQNHQLQETYLPAIGDPWSTQSLSANYGTPDTTTTPTAVVHGAGATGSAAACGFTSVYTVDQGSDDLQETYLPVIGGPWTSQNLSGNYGTPAVAPGTAPVALVHMNFTSVYTVDQGSDQLQETYLPAIGDPWTTQSLSANYGTPTTDQTPIVLLHPDASGNLDWTSVYTIDEFSDHLQETYLPNAGFPGDPWVTQDLTAKYGSPEVAAADDPTADASVVHSGYTSVYSVDSSGNLWETYLPAMGDSWSAQDLSAKYGTPKVMNGTAPVAITHDGYTSVYTIDQGGDGVSAGDLQETYLPAIGDSWSTQDLSSQFGTPASDTTPTALFHDGYTSVYSVQDATTSAGAAGDLWETYLPAAGFPGDPWHSQNLSQNYGTPIVDAFTSPTAILHDGYVSVYTVDASTSNSALGDLQETYLPAIGDPWISQNLSVKYGTPVVNVLTSPAAVVHNGYVSVYTVDANGDNVEQGDLQETYLPAIGDAWSTQDLSTNYHTPQVEGGEPPVPLTHDGFTSVYTVDAGGSGTTQGDLQETYLPAISDPWTTQDLSSKYGAPGTDDLVTALLHYDTSGGLTWTSLYTFDSGSGDLQETYLPNTGFPGDSWDTQNLTSIYGAPAL
jgi:hypothetical protein